MNVKDIFTVVIFGVVVNSQAQEVIDFKSLDHEFVEEVAERNFYNDYRTFEVIEVSESGDSTVVASVKTEARPNTGFEIGASVGAETFNGFFTPTFNVNAGYLGKRFSFIGTVGIGSSEYNSEASNAGDKYLMVKATFGIGLKLVDWGNAKGYLSQNQIELLAEGGYMGKRNYNAYSAESELYELTQDVRVKGATITYGAYLKYTHKVWMKGLNMFVKAGAFVGHEYYASGSKAKLGAAVQIGFNKILGSKIKKNHAAVKKLQSYYGIDYNEAINQLRVAAKAKK